MSSEGSTKEPKGVMQQKLNRVPTHKEIMREANTVIPVPNILRSNVVHVLKYVVGKDAVTNIMESTHHDDDTTPNPRRFLKALTPDVRNHIKQQMSHIDKGCLSDPPPQVDCAGGISRWNGGVWQSQSYEC